MPIHVKVLSQEDYSAWVKSKQETKTAAVSAADPAMAKSTN
jgi:heme/copper-type cytochrome/quinol oxidase subunit 2